MNKCEKQGEHRYEKFDDRSVFCVRCGDQKFLSTSAPHWVYYPPIYPTYPQPYWYYTPTITSGSTTIGSTTTFDFNDQFTYTVLNSGSDNDA